MSGEYDHTAVCVRVRGRGGAPCSLYHGTLTASVWWREGGKFKVHLTPLAPTLNTYWKGNIATWHLSSQSESFTRQSYWISGRFTMAWTAGSGLYQYNVIV